MSQTGVTEPKIGQLTAFVGAVGRFFTQRAELVGALLHLFLLVVKSVYLEWGKGRAVIGQNIAIQIRYTGVDAFGLISQIGVLMGFVVGFLVVALANSQVSRAYAPQFQQMFIELSSTTTAPLLITLIVIARSATAISTELGIMSIRKELQVFDALGINPYYFLIYPRIVGMVVSLLCLTIYFNFLVIAIHFLYVEHFALVQSVRLEQSVGKAVQLVNLIQALLKTTFIGVGIALIACHFGLSVKRSVTEVPQMATKSVMTSIVFSILANLIIVVIFAMLFGFQFLKK